MTSPFAIIIPSRNPANLVACVRAIMAHEPEFELSNLVVVDDGARAGAEAMLPAGIIWVDGIKPFNFARNVNRGILLGCLATQDVILLNDDALLESPRGLTRLALQAKAWGIVSATTNFAGNPLQFRQIGSDGLRPETRDRALAFVCVCIPHWVIQQKVGLLDERFQTYGWEDADYCRRARLAGVNYGVFDGCFVDHGKLKPTFRPKPESPGDIEPGRLIYLDKWKTEIWRMY